MSRESGACSLAFSSASAASTYFFCSYSRSACFTSSLAEGPLACAARGVSSRAVHRSRTNLMAAEPTPNHSGRSLLMRKGGSTHRRAGLTRRVSGLSTLETRDEQLALQRQRLGGLESQGLEEDLLVLQLRLPLVRLDG